MIKNMRLSFLMALGALMLVIGGIVCGSAYYRYHAVQQQLRDADQKTLESYERLQRSQEDQRQIIDKLERYNRLVQSGVIGPEQRLAWVEEIRKLRERLGLLSAQAEFMPRAPLALPGVPVALGHHQLFASSMSMTLPLLHELDLLRFLQGLTNEASALIYPLSCTVSHGASAEDVRLQAQCKILWITAEKI